MDEDENAQEGVVALNHTNEGAGLSGEDKEVELPPALLSSYDDAGLIGTPPSGKKGKKW